VIQTYEDGFIITGNVIDQR